MLRGHGGARLAVHFPTTAVGARHRSLEAPARWRTGPRPPITSSGRALARLAPTTTARSTRRAPERRLRLLGRLTAGPDARDARSSRRGEEARHGGRAHRGSRSWLGPRRGMARGDHRSPAPRKLAGRPGPLAREGRRRPHRAGSGCRRRTLELRSLPRRRTAGGVLLGIGAIAVLLGLALIATDILPDGEITPTSLAFYLGGFVLPGLVAMGVGALVGKRASIPPS